MNDEKLIGWLVAIRWQWVQSGTAHVPTRVMDALVARGWIGKPDAPDWQGHQPCGMTQAGGATYDLNAPEWGIDTIPAEEPA